jgi:hypothetical protein
MNYHLSLPAIYNAIIPASMELNEDIKSPLNIKKKEAHKKMPLYIK